VACSFVSTIFKKLQVEKEGNYHEERIKRTFNNFGGLEFSTEDDTFDQIEALDHKGIKEKNLVLWLEQVVQDEFDSQTDEWDE